MIIGNVPLGRARRGDELWLDPESDDPSIEPIPEETACPRCDEPVTPDEEGHCPICGWCLRVDR